MKGFIGFLLSSEAMFSAFKKEVLSSKNRLYRATVEGLSSLVLSYLRLLAYI